MVVNLKVLSVLVCRFHIIRLLSHPLHKNAFITSVVSRVKFGGNGSILRDWRGGSSKVLREDYWEFVCAVSTSLDYLVTL